MNAQKHVAPLGGFTILHIFAFALISGAGILCATLRPLGERSSPLIVASVFGILTVLFLSLSVSWRIVGDKLIVSQLGIRMNMRMEDISRIEVMQNMTWKQGVGIRHLGPGSWAMLCGTPELVSIEHGERRVIFSVADSEPLLQIFERD